MFLTKAEINRRGGLNNQAMAKIFKRFKDKVKVKVILKELKAAYGSTVKKKLPHYDEDQLIELYGEFVKEGLVKRIKARIGKNT